LIVELIEQGINHVYDSKQENDKRNMNAIHPSALFDCMRLQWYEALGYEIEPPSTKLKSIFLDGHDFHKNMQNMMIELGYSKPEWTEIPLTGPYGIEGHADQVININGELILIDYKSVGSDPEEWYGKKKWKDMVSDPPLRYKMQLIVYMELLRQRGFDIKRGYFLFKRKHDGELDEYGMNQDDFLYDLALQRARELREHIDYNILPEREGAKDASPCKWCRAKKVCWSGKENKQRCIVVI
jgi:CRISPR/Cas system-associated exonuclease Cas4 (RecB family)